MSKVKTRTNQPVYGVGKVAEDVTSVGTKLYKHTLVLSGAGFGGNISFISTDNTDLSSSAISYADRTKFERVFNKSVASFEGGNGTTVSQMLYMYVSPPQPTSYLRVYFGSINLSTGVYTADTYSGANFTKCTDTVTEL